MLQTQMSLRVRQMTSVREIQHKGGPGTIHELEGTCPGGQPLHPAAHCCVRMWPQSCQILSLFISRKARNLDTDVNFPIF